MTGKARMGPTCISPPSYSSTRVLHKSLGLPLISALHEPQWAALQFQRTARSGACWACIVSTASRTTIPSTSGISYSTSWPPSASPRKILSFAVLPSAVAISSECTSACALEAMSFRLAASLSKSNPSSSVRASELALRPASLAARHVSDLAFDQRGQVLRHRRYLSSLDADLALGALLDDEVDLAELLVWTVEVEAPLRPAALLALERGAEDDLGDLDQIAYVLRRVPAGVEEPRPPHIDVG